MTVPLLGPAGLAVLLFDAVRGYGSQRAFARSVGVSEQLLCDVLNGRREPNEALLRAVGLRRVVRYARLSNAEGARA